MNRLPTRLFAAITFALSLIASALLAPSVMAQANVQGSWQTLPYTMPINPVHAALLKTGKVLIVSGSGNLPSNLNYQAALWDPQAGTITTQPLAWDMFCNGMVVLPDGRPFVMSGTLQYDPFHGELRTSIYDPSLGTFTDQQNMAHGRWYPTATVLGDGRVFVFSGLDETGATNTSVEIYTVGSGWGPPFSAPWTPPLYPRMHLLPNGNLFYSGATTGSSYFNTSTNTWTTNVAFTNYSGTRTYGSSVLLPLTPANGYKPRVMIFGGGSPSTATTEIIDLSAATPKWTYGPNMSQPRIEMNATILPSGQVLTVGGSLNDEDTATASLKADLFDANGASVAPAGSEAFARLYHSVSLLMPDATVWVAGGNPARGTYEPHMEIYTPPYLYNSSGTLATRPAISSLSSGVIGYGGAFQVQTPDAPNISTVVLMRNGAVTHAFNMDQRYVGLSFTVGSGVLNVTGPPNGNVAPPGYYMLFILNSSGVPSMASMVQVSAAAGDIPPTGTITNPVSNVSISAGQSIFYSGTGTDPDGTISAYSWSFPGGTPSLSILANPGSVTYSTAGTYVTTFTVTDNAGLTDPNPPTRTITVVPVAGPGIAFQQVHSATPQSPQTSVAVTYSGAQAAGDLNVVVVGWNDSTATVSSVTDSKGNLYALGASPVVQPGTASQAIYYARNIASAAAGANVVTVKFSTAANYPDIRIAEYSGLDAANPLDGSAGAQGNSATGSSGNLTTTNANDLLIGANLVQTGTPGPGTGFTNRLITYPDGDIIEDAIVNSAGSYSATAPVGPSAPWIMQIIAFKGAGATPTPTAPSNLTTTASGPVQINLSWTASTESGGTISQYLIERCLGASCSNFAQVGTSATIIYSDTGLSGATAYNYRVRAMDTANSAGPYSNTATATTAPPTFTAPSNLTAAAAGPVQVNLNWTAGTETGGTLTNYLIERCTGATCTTFAQVGTSATTTFSDTSAGLLGSTAYSYRVRATDGTNNSGYSNVAQATTAAPTFTAPSNLAATASSSTQINLAWTAATETGGTISQYLIERCAGASCGNTPTNFAQVATSATTTYNDIGLTGSTSYSYRVRASDGTNNSAYSNIVSATTPANTPTAPANLTATASGPVQINLSWTASTETGGTIAKYLIERCTGATCTAFAQVGTSATTTFSDTTAGLLGSTTYSYRVRAQDTMNNMGPYSNTATATTAAPAFTVPSGLTATASGPVQVNLSWTAGTETGGTITNYLIERCTGATCTTFAQVGSSATTGFSDTSAGLLGSTTYSYRVRATDGTNNSGYSNVAQATTAAPTFTAPSSLAATAAGNTQINLSWTAATETGGTITNYLIERCTGAACTSFAQVATSAATTFSDTGLLAGTRYV